MLVMEHDQGLTERHQVLLGFVRMLTKSSSKGALIIAGNVIEKTDTDTASHVHERCRVRKNVLLQYMQVQAQSQSQAQTQAQTHLSHSTTSCLDLRRL